MKGKKSKANWTPEAHDRAWNRLLETINNPKTPSSYHRKKQNLEAITDDFERY